MVNEVRILTLARSSTTVINVLSSRIQIPMILSWTQTLTKLFDFLKQVSQTVRSATLKLTQTFPLSPFSKSMAHWCSKSKHQR